MVGAVLVLAGVTVPAAAAAPAPRGTLFVEGDSLTVGATKSIRSHLSADFRTITVDAEVGRSTPTGIARLNAGRNANVWVMALGTNDGPDPRTMKRNVRTVLQRAGSRPVLWVSVWRTPEYRKINRMLSRVDRKYPQLSVLRWDRFIARHPRLLAGDRIHLTPAGYEVRGRMIADAVRALLTERNS